MGLDAPSQDLTARVRARRQAEVAAGNVEPALPGEHRIHGTGRGIDIERVVAGADARDRRAARQAPVNDTVVDFEYLPGEEEALGLTLAPEDGGEVPLPDETLELTTDDALIADGAEVVQSWKDEAQVDTAQYQAVQVEILARLTNIENWLRGHDGSFEGLGNALVMIAGALAEVQKATAERDTEPEPEAPKLPWYKRF